MRLAQTLVNILQRSGDVEVPMPALGRLLLASTPDDRVAAICAEIGETVLQRKLTFRIGDKASLVVNAGGRRLIQVVSVEPPSLARAGDAIFGLRDDANLSVQMTALGRALAAFSGLDGDLSVTTAPADNAQAAIGVGFPPDKLYESAIPKAKPAHKADRTAAATSSTATTAAAAAPTAKFSPTEAMKAMIREKVAEATSAAATAAATNPGPSKAAATTAKPAGATGDESLRAFFAEIQNEVSFCAILNRDGNVEAVAGKEKDERILDHAEAIMADIVRWREITTTVLSRSQIIILKAAGIQNQSIAYFTDDYGVVLAIFVNTDLSRIFAAANKILRGGIGR
jgi:hypothetical protein